MYPLFETIRIDDGSPQNLEWHRRRMERSFMGCFHCSIPFLIRDVFRESGIPQNYQTGRVKCRFLYSADHYELQFEHYVPRIVKTLKLVEDNQLDYAMKFTDRDAFTRLLGEKGDCDDILIIKDGKITDSSYTNIVFFDGERWVTPLFPLLEGTCRNRLIAFGRIFPTDITTMDLLRFRSFKLINAMLDFDAQPELPIQHIVD